MAGRVERATRFPFSGEATLFLRSDQLRVSIENLSASGMLLELPSGIAPAPFMRLQFKIGPRERWMALDAIFAREEPDNGKQRWGVRFLEPPGVFEEALRSHIETQEDPPEVRADPAPGGGAPQEPTPEVRADPAPGGGAPQEEPTPGPEETVSAAPEPPEDPPDDDPASPPRVTRSRIFG